MTPAWYCIRSHPKHEHIAEAHLRREAQLEVYLPRIRFRRPTRGGLVWFTEPLFPNYLFARFGLRSRLRQVHHTPGVGGVLHFGNQWPAIPDPVIDDLRSVVAPDTVQVVGEELLPGDSVIISGGALHDLRAVVTRVMPGRQRVAVLLEFLGRQTTMELPARDLVAEEGRYRELKSREKGKGWNGSERGDLSGHGPDNPPVASR